MDFYIVLGVGREASTLDIKRAYKRLARRYHPDINPGDHTAEGRFRQIVEAYETLIDPDRRHRYDAHGAGGSGGPSAATFGFEGFDFTVSVNGAQAPTFGDLFADVLRDRQAGQGGEPSRGADLHQTVTVPFDEAVKGGRRQVMLTRLERCRPCRGAGRLHVQATPCTECQGRGAVKSVRGHMVFSKPCPACQGTGHQRDMMCPACAGQSIEMRTEALMLTVPPGLPEGARLRIEGKGHAGRFGGAPGDLYITAHVEPHPVFRREGDDVHVTVPVAVHEAALGARVDVPSLDGPVKLKVPPGTQSGQRFRLRDRGVPSVQGDRRGDMVVEVRLVLPRMLDERSKELLREFGRINTEDVRQELARQAGAPTGRQQP